MCFVFSILITIRGSLKQGCKRSKILAIDRSKCPFATDPIDQLFDRWSQRYRYDQIAFDLAIDRSKHRSSIEK